MNSLNILTHIGSTPPPSPNRSRRASLSNALHSHSPSDSSPLANDAGAGFITTLDEKSNMFAEAGASYTREDARASRYDEKTPLLSHSEEAPFEVAKVSRAWLIPRRISEAVVGIVKLLLKVVTVPGQYLVACFYDDAGHFSVITPVYRISRRISRLGARGKRKTPAEPHMHASDSSDVSEKGRRKSKRIISGAQSSAMKVTGRSPSLDSTSAIISDSEHDSERPPTRDDNDSPSRHTRSKSNASSTMEEIAPAKRSIRIKLHNEEALRQRKAKRGASRSASDGSSHVSPEAAAALKSPTGSTTVASKQLTKFPRAPQPPRPLVPRRQPSYSMSGASSLGPHEKTLIIDLDETLIHTFSKGGRYTTGHMVEVKLQQPVSADGKTIPPEVPILYYVHKRPGCDEFLKKVCKWYNLVVFTAAVQEYADPVIDLLELERKYFSARYYRQHCTLRKPTTYIKDLAQVEPDLSKVMILDNSPISYIFHPDNAIPIEGWISDPTDNELLHLIPMLEGLQYVTDVRALLALRLGQPPSA